MRSRSALLVAGIDDVARLAFHDGVRNAARVRHDDRETNRHCLQYRVWEAFTGGVQIRMKMRRFVF